MKYLYTNKQDDEKFIVELESKDDIRHWMINHLDISKDWHVEKYEVLEDIQKDMDDFFSDMDKEIYGDGQEDKS